MKTSIEDCTVMDVPKIADTRGNLAVVEGNTLPFTFKRVYFLYDVPSDAHRGGHAHKEQQEFLIAVSGSFDVVLDDGKNKKSVTLNKPDKGLLITTGIWRELGNFSSGAICLVFSSGFFLEEDYIREYIEFKNLYL